MSIAFGHFDEPIAWLMRGLIEYGWVDLSRNRVLPSHAVGGFDLSFIPDSQGQSGIMLRVPAIAGNQRCHADEAYTFEVKLTDVSGAPGFAVRSEACNYLQEFAFSPDNPVWAAGYIHQALTEYVAEFVRWRLGGGELTWAQRQGVPAVEGGPCSASLATWVRQQLSLQREFDATLWGQGVQRTQATSTPSAPMITEGNFGKKTPGSTRPIDLISGPSRALFTMICLGGTASALAFFNILVTVALFGLNRPFALWTNALLVVFGGGGAVVAWLGLREYRQLRGSFLPWVAIIYPSLVPICCLGGIPVSIWAAMRWQSDPVLQRRRANNQRP